MSEITQERYQYTQNRELSWLRFNKRVLEEAADVLVPALERLKFVSIFCSNLDEFFMVRVGSLFDISRMRPDDTDNKTGWTASEQLQYIYRAVPELLVMKEQICTAVMETLKSYGIRDVGMEDLTADEMKWVNRFFKAEMLPILSPFVVGPNHPVPHFANKNLYVVALLDGKKSKKAIGIAPLPESLPPVLMLPDGKRFVRMENILLHRLPTLFGSYTAKESCILCVTRNADLSIDDERFEDREEDYRFLMKELLKRRKRLGVVRLELSTAISEDFYERITDMIKVSSYQIFIDSCPLNMQYAFRLIDELPKELTPKLLYTPYKARWPEDLDPNEKILTQVQQHDRLLSYPYDSVEPFLRLLSEAAEDPYVLSIKITIYRLAESSRIAQILSRAAENGKEVLVLIELRARFDEENNLGWSDILEESGCQVIYGAEDFKCHSKVCLITMRNRNRMSYITQIGTGNYNEKTNAMYTDLSLMTADTEIGEDAAAFFRNMLIDELEGQYTKLCVSPFRIKNMLMEKIDAQIALGEEGYVCIKANSVTEREIIDKMMQASQAGVEIQLIIRGICCILPGIPGYTENIHITSIVGRYLEHSRIYCFGRGKEAEYYISSADLMTRNLIRRVEIACPVLDPVLKEQLRWMLEVGLRDTAKASFMLPDGTYSRKQGAVPLSSQPHFMVHSPHIPIEREVKKPGFADRLRAFMEKIIKR